jgi:hypothetical protein
MFQEIFTYIIILSASAYTLYSIYRLFFPNAKSKSNSCSGSCAHCQLKFDHKIYSQFKK